MAIGLRQDIEAEVARLHAAGDFAGAVRKGYEAYGPEIRAFLEGELQNPGLAMDAFSQLGLDLWRGIGGFRFGSSFRTWAYRLARNAMYRLHRDPHARRARYELPPELTQIEASARSSTAPWRKTEVKDAFTRIRESLAPEDRALLTLRLDRDMPWQDVALIMLEESGDSAPTPADVRKKATALRKRYSRLTEELRQRFVAEGLLGQGP